MGCESPLQSDSRRHGSALAFADFDAISANVSALAKQQPLVTFLRDIRHRTRVVCGPLARAKGAPHLKPITVTGLLLVSISPVIRCTSPPGLRQAKFPTQRPWKWRCRVGHLAPCGHPDMPEVAAGGTLALVNAVASTDLEVKNCVSKTPGTDEQLQARRQTPAGEATYAAPAHGRAELFDEHSVQADTGVDLDSPSGSPRNEVNVESH